MTHPASRRRESTRVALFAILLGVTVALLLAFTYTTVVTQHAAGIYAQAQATWMQAHTRSVMHLRRYWRSHDPRELDAFDTMMRAPLAFERARRLMDRKDPDRKAGAAAFVEGGLDPADARRAAQFGRVMRYVEPGRKGLAAWEAGDSLFGELRSSAAALEAASARGDTAAMTAMIARVDSVDLALLQLEREFARNLADASRRLPPLLLAVGMLLGAILVTAGIITFQRVAQAAARSRRAEREYFEKLHSLMEAIPDVVMWYDRDRRITYANAAAEALTGLPRGEVIGRSHAEVAALTGTRAEAVDAWDAAIARAFQGESESVYAAEVMGRNGRARAFQARFAAQRDDSGEIETVLAIGRDITALRESETALREREMELRHAQKLEAVGRLAGGVAHEFNNVLTAITANLELALLGLPADDPIRQDLITALSAARRASGLTRQLLVFGRRDPGEARRVDLGRLLAELEVMLQRLTGDQVELVITASAAPALVDADPGQLQQILLNLVGNARDAMAGGGTVHIETGHASPAALDAMPGLLSADSPSIGAAAPPAHGWVTLSVRDTGTGMDRRTVERILEPFFTTKGPGAGSGLGLPVVNGIVLQLGGRVYLETAPGRGSRFTIALPAAAPRTDAGGDPGQRSLHTTSEMLAAASRAAPRGNGERVLLVEDEAPVRAAARRMLEKAGYAVIEAKHADDALMLWHQQPVDIVVTDFMMPGASGGDLIARLRADRPGLPALIVSGYTGGQTIGPEMLRGRTDVLQKPFARADLLDRVRKLLDGDAV